MVWKPENKGLKPLVTEKWILFFLFSLQLVVRIPFALDNHVFIDDIGGYLFLSESLVRGDFMRFYFEPGLSVLLAPFVFFSDSTDIYSVMFAANFGMSVLTALGGIVIYLVTLRWTNSQLAAILANLNLLIFTYMPVEVRTNPNFLLGFLILLIIWGIIEQERRINKTGISIFIGVVFAVAYMVRAESLLLYPAYALYFLLRYCTLYFWKHPEVIITVLSMVIFTLPYFLFKFYWWGSAVPEEVGGGAEPISFRDVLDSLYVIVVYYLPANVTVLSVPLFGLAVWGLLARQKKIGLGFLLAFVTLYYLGIWFNLIVTKYPLDLLQLSFDSPDIMHDIATRYYAMFMPSLFCLAGVGQWRLLQWMQRQSQSQLLYALFAGGMLLVAFFNVQRGVDEFNRIQNIADDVLVTHQIALDMRQSRNYQDQTILTLVNMPDNEVTQFSVLAGGANKLLTFSQGKPYLNAYSAFYPSEVDELMWCAYWCADPRDLPDKVENQDNLQKYALPLLYLQPQALRELGVDYLLVDTYWTPRKTYLTAWEDIQNENGFEKIFETDTRALYRIENPPQPQPTTEISYQFLEFVTELNQPILNPTQGNFLDTFTKIAQFEFDEVAWSEYVTRLEKFNELVVKAEASDWRATKLPADLEKAGFCYVAINNIWYSFASNAEIEILNTQYERVFAADNPARGEFFYVYSACPT